MGKNLKRFTLALCLVVLCVSMMSVTALAACEPVTATIPVDITLTGTLPETPDTFKVELTADEEGNPMPEGATDGVYTMDMVGASSGELKIQFSKLGIYNYTVKQLDIGNGDCYQDTHTYKVTAFVTNNATYDAFNLSVVVCRDDQTDKQDDILFENRYANPDEITISATKTLDGKTPKDGAFTFELLDSEGKLIETVKNAGQNVTFTTLSYYEIGTFEYQIKEVKGDTAGIIYDKSVYDVIVDVTKDADGNYAAKLTYEKDGKALEAAPAFANKTQTTSPDTGEGTVIYVMGGLMVVSAVAIVALVLMMKKKQTGEETEE